MAHVKFRSALIRVNLKEWGISVRSLAGDAAIRKFPFPSTVRSRVFRWAPDGRSLALIANEKGAANVWLQPLNGEPRRQLTSFTDPQLKSFVWSQDGHWLGFLRRAATSDVVMLSGFK